MNNGQPLPRRGASSAKGVMGTNWWPAGVGQAKAGAQWADLPGRRSEKRPLARKIRKAQLVNKRQNREAA